MAHWPGRRHPVRPPPRAPAGPTGRHARRPPAPPRHLGRPRPRLATGHLAAAARPRRHVRRRHPYLLDSSLAVRLVGAAGVAARPPPAQATGCEMGEPVAAAPTARARTQAGADHPGAPRPPPRPPPRPAVPGRRTMPLGPGLRPTRVIQDP